MRVVVDRAGDERLRAEREVEDARRSCTSAPADGEQRVDAAVAHAPEDGAQDLVQRVALPGSAALAGRCRVSSNPRARRSCTSGCPTLRSRLLEACPRLAGFTPHDDELARLHLREVRALLACLVRSGSVGGIVVLLRPVDRRDEPVVAVVGERVQAVDDLLLRELRARRASSPVHELGRRRSNRWPRPRRVLPDLLPIHSR